MRRRLWIVFAVFTAAVVALASWTAWARANRAVEWEAIQFSVADDTRAVITFRVVVRQGDTAVCTVRARNTGFAEVGLVDRRVGPFPGGAGRVTVEIPTSERAVNADVKSCIPG